MARIFSLILFCFVGLSFLAHTQVCLPNTSLSPPGVYPDSATGLAAATINEPYSQTLTILVPYDTVLGTATILVDYIELISFTGFPNGISYQCEPSNCVWPGDTYGCAILSGTPTEMGNFQLKAVMHGYVAGVPAPIIDSLNYYYINVQWPAAINKNASHIEIADVFPNPGDNQITVSYTLKNSSKINFSLFDLLGKQVINNSFSGTPGSNSLYINISSIPSGTYVYRLKSKTGISVAKKLTIIH